MIGQLFDIDCFKILSLFSVSPGSGFNRNKIKETTKLNNVPLDNALNKLLKSEILRNDKRVYRINFENDYSKKMLEIVTKQHMELKDLPLNVYFLLIDLVESLSTTKKIEVYLFGSYSKLIYKEKSDVDIAVLVPDGFNIDAINKLTKKLEKNYGKRVEVHDFIKDTFYKNKKDPLVKDILQNGIRLI
jgi:predicted nucleotidyltransferase